jgi:glycosyltransferase involved in cell wall biosynthesis
MRHTILSVAYPLTEVGPDAAGGSEQVLTMLDRALTEEGHTSLVIAADGSKVSGTLIPSPKPAGIIDDSMRRWAQQAHRQLIQETLATHSVSLIHMHSLDFHCYLPDGAVPILATLHLPADWYPPKIFHLRRSNLYLNCVSGFQHTACPPGPHLLPHISNGVPVDRLGIKAVARGDYVLSLGRICPEKGFHFALDAAKLADAEMLLAGTIYPYDLHEHYFEDEIMPRLDSRRQFVGPAGFAKKRKLLAQARCVLVPSTVAETSSLVAMEAAAAGTPVIAYASGALPEIVEHGRTGFIVSDVEEMARAISLVDRLDRDACRGAARTRFSAAEMVRQYLDTYDRLIEKVHYREDYRIRPGVSWLV